MSRLLALCVLLTVLLTAGCARWGHKGLQTPPPLDLGGAAQPGPAAEAPQPLNPEPEYLKTADAFFAAWAKGDTKAAYGMLGNRLRTLMTEQDFASQLADVKLKTAKTVAHAGTGAVAYAVASVDLARPVSGTPIAGYSLLLKKTNGQWQVALFLAEEKLATKYSNLLIIPNAKGKGYIVTYTDEQGNQNRSDLQEP